MAMNADKGYKKCGLYLYETECEGLNGESDYILKPATSKNGKNLTSDGRLYISSRELIELINNNVIAIGDMYIDEFDDLVYDATDSDSLADNPDNTDAVIITRNIITSLDMAVKLNFKTMPMDKLKVIIKRAKRIGGRGGRIATVRDGELYFFTTDDSLTLLSPNTIKLSGETGLFKDTDFSSIDLREVDMSDVVDMTDMFNYTYAKEILFGDFDFSHVERMDSTFESVDMKKLDLRNANLSNVRSMNRCFYKATIRNLDMYNVDTTKNKPMANEIFAFSRCTVSKTDKFEYTDLSVIKAEK